MVTVKICGVTNIEDAYAAAQLGADMLGFNFYARSPRYITTEAAFALCEALRAELGTDCPALVGVFVNEIVSNISRTIDDVGLDFAQLSGDESGEMLRELRGLAYKAIRPRSEAEALEDAAYFANFEPSNPYMPTLLVDAYNPDLYGGTGEQASEAVARAVNEVTPRMMLAGGLTPENVAARIAAVQPWGVDVASGVESAPGLKDHDRMWAFIAAAKGG